MANHRNIADLPLNPGRIVVMDTETTGFYKDDHIIELAAIEIINDKLTGNQFHCFFQPRKPMTESALNAHKMDNDFYSKNYSEYMGEAQNLLNSFKNFCGDSLVFAHNAFFDINMLTKEFSFHNLNGLNFTKFRCTMKIFRNLIGDEHGYSLGKACNYFEIPFFKVNAHGALYDSLLCAKLLIKMIKKNREEINKNQGNKSVLVTRKKTPKKKISEKKTTTTLESKEKIVRKRREVNKNDLMKMKRMTEIIVDKKKSERKKPIKIKDKKLNNLNKNQENRGNSLVINETQTHNEVNTSNESNPFLDLKIFIDKRILNENPSKEGENKCETNEESNLKSNEMCSQEKTNFFI